MINVLKRIRKEAIRPNRGATPMFAWREGDKQRKS
jgi:hypothetical protein